MSDSVSYCINPNCHQRQNSSYSEKCAACGTPLLIQQRYRLVEPLRSLDQAAPTEVFAAEAQGTPYVLKVLKDMAMIAPFDREAQLLQQLRHPGIPQVQPDGYFRVSIDKGARQLACLVMEKIEGQNLEAWLEAHSAVSESLARSWLRQLVEILDFLHRNQLFHRDIKPSNIMLRSNGQLALIDFGTVRKVTHTYLAKVGGGQEVTGIVSPGYTPLEQINGKAVPQSDFYALGRSFVYLLTGKHPIDFPEDPQTGQLRWRDSAPVSGSFAALIDDLIAPFPGQRPLNTQEILQRLARSPPAERLASAPRPAPPSPTALRLLQLLNLGLFLMLLVTVPLWMQARGWFALPDRPPPAQLR